MTLLLRRGKFGEFCWLCHGFNESRTYIIPTRIGKGSGESIHDHAGGNGISLDGLRQEECAGNLLSRSNVSLNFYFRFSCWMRFIPRRKFFNYINHRKECFSKFKLQ